MAGNSARSLPLAALIRRRTKRTAPPGSCCLTNSTDGYGAAPTHRLKIAISTTPLRMALSGLALSDDEIDRRQTGRK
jgi:hypothetical protein